MSTFIDACAFVHDASEAGPARFLHGLPPTNFPVRLRGQCLVLSLDMKRAFYKMSSVSRADDLHSMLNDYMNSKLENFLCHYYDRLNIDLCRVPACLRTWSQGTFRTVMVKSAIIFLFPLSRSFQELVAETDDRVLLFVDDFNYPLIHSNSDNADLIIDSIVTHLVNPVRAAMDNQLIVGGMFAGRPASEEPAWTKFDMDYFLSPITHDISNEDIVAGAFGFTLLEVENLARELLRDAIAESELVAQVKRLDNRYAFGKTSNTAYPMNEVLALLRERTGEIVDTDEDADDLMPPSDDEDSE